MEQLKEALQYVVGLGNDAEKTEVLEINGKTYANRNLQRYDKVPKAEPVKTSTLSSMVDYITSCNDEFGQKMIIHIISPSKVRFISSLDKEREREALFETYAETSEFQFGQWFDQERFMIELQANFKKNEDLEAVMKMAGNIDKKNDQKFTDDGVTQIATISVGVASKAEALVPNPVELIPYRTFQEIAQPSSKFVFRIGDKEVPAFKLIEAEGGIWKNEAIENIKSYFYQNLEHVEQSVREKIVIIG